MLDLDMFHITVDELEMPSSQKNLEKLVDESVSAFKLIFRFRTKKAENGK